MRPAEIVTVVPAADEEAVIGASLDALARAALAVPPEVRTRTVVVADRCSDATADLAAARPGVEVVVTDVRCVGAARALGVAAAFTGGGPDGVWIASTDADTLVPPDWLRHVLDTAAAGHDLLVGTVVPDDDLDPGRRVAFDAAYSPVDGHPHVHGANLAIRGRAYTALGGWRPLRTGEDVDLVARADAAGLDVHRCAAVPVRTSARLHGRAPDGFAAHLEALPSARPA